MPTCMCVCVCVLWVQREKKCQMGQRALGPYYVLLPRASLSFKSILESKTKSQQPSILEDDVTIPMNAFIYCQQIVKSRVKNKISLRILSHNEIIEISNVPWGRILKSLHWQICIYVGGVRGNGVIFLLFLHLGKSQQAKLWTIWRWNIMLKANKNIITTIGLEITREIY